MPDMYGNPTAADFITGGSVPTRQYSAADQQIAAANSAAQNAWYDAQAQNLGTKAAQDAAQQAWQRAYYTAQLSGYFGAGVGNGTVAGQATMPNIQWTADAFGQYYPGGFNTVAPGTWTQAQIQNMQKYGLDQAGVTGVYYDPGQMTYRPGQFIMDQETGGIGQIQSNGRLQMFGDQGDFLRAGGSWDMVNNPDMVRRVSSAEYNALANQPGANFGGRGNGTASMALQAMYGSYGLPTEGQQTLGAQAQYFDQAQQLAAMYGTAFSPNTVGGTAQAGVNAPTQGQQTLAAQQQYWNQAFAQSQANQQNTQKYLELLSSLRGPADWAKYQQVLGSTPGGMRDLYAAAMGQYIPGGGATTGQAPQAASLQTLQGDVAGAQGWGYGGGWGGYQGGYTTQPGQPQTAQTGQTSPGSGQVWGSGIGIGQQQLTPEQQAQATGNGTNMYGGQQQQYNLPAPNQISAQAWNNMAPSQQQMLYGMYEYGGWDKNDVEALRRQALPKYANNSPTAGTWRLQ